MWFSPERLTTVRKQAKLKQKKSILHLKVSKISTKISNYKIRISKWLESDYFLDLFFK